MVRIFLTCLLLLGVSSARAEAETTRNYPQFGISVTVPDKWRAVESGDYLLLVSDTEAGLVAMTLNRATDVTQLKEAAGEGINADGVRLRRSGDFEKVGVEGLGAEFSGSFDGAAAKAFVAGVINPFGRGVTIAAVTSTASYGEAQVALVKEIADGLKFAQPIEPQNMKDWKRRLPRHKLTYMRTSGGSGTSYTDSSGYIYSTYSGSSSRHSISFCGTGRFYSSSSEMASFDSRGGFGMTAGRGAGEGVWSIEPGEGAAVLLVLEFDSGAWREYTLTREDGKTRLNGTRYFYTATDWCG